MCNVVSDVMLVVNSLCSRIGGLDFADGLASRSTDNFCTTLPGFPGEMGSVHEHLSSRNIAKYGLL